MADPENYDDWTDERKGAFRQALRARQERQVRAGRLFGLALVALVAAGVLLRLPESWWIPAVGAVALAGLVHRMVNWTCPNCGDRLCARRGSRCLGCGAPLDV
jgi:4-hydroxybenzoate polyprenyltransferase